MSEATIEVGLDSADAAAIAAETHDTALVGADERLAYRGVFQRLLIRPEIGAIIGAAAIWAFFWAVATEFGKAGTTASVLDVSATLGIMAVAVSLLMIGGEFDLSSGAATGALGIITILIVKDVGELGGAGLSLYVAIPASLIVALALGWFNGTMVERTGLPSFIVTLATFFILRGFKLGFSKLIIDNISVGRIDEGHGYNFFRPIFDYVWGRNDHQFGNDSLRYSLAISVGVAMLVVAIVVTLVKRGRTGAVDARTSGSLAAVGAVLALVFFLTNFGIQTETVRFSIVVLGLAIALAALFLSTDSNAGLFGLGVIGGALTLLAIGYKFGTRDNVYVIAVLGGMALIAVAIFELNFSRNSELKPAGAVMFLAGAAGAIGGVIFMHRTDGVNNNAIAAVIIGVSLLVGFLGLAEWRYQRQAAGSLGLDRGILVLSGAGLVSVILGVVASRALHHGAEPDFVEQSQRSVLDLLGNLVWPLVLLVSVFGAYKAFERSVSESRRTGQSFLISLVGGLVALIVLGIAVSQILIASEERTNSAQDGTTIDVQGFLLWTVIGLAAVVGAVVALGSSLRDESRDGRAIVRDVLAIIAIALAAGCGTYGFMFMATEEGLRAILMAVLILGGIAALGIAASRAAKKSPISRGAILTLIAVVGLVLALLMRSASGTPKFRNESFSVTLMVSLLILIWAVVSTRFETRKSTDLEAQALGGRMAVAGLVSVTVGVAARLLYTTQEELDAGVTPANFRMSVLWFVGITIFATWLLGRTQFGSWIFAVGGNKQAARQIGVPAARTKTQLFMIVSVAAWLVGLLLAFRLNTLQSGTGNGLEFEYIIAAVVGGTLLTGGYGSAFGAAIGAVIMAMSKQGIPAARWNSDWRFAFLGVILLTAVIANNFIKTKAEEAGR